MCHSTAAMMRQPNQRCLCCLEKSSLCADASSSSSDKTPNLAASSLIAASTGTDRTLLTVLLSGAAASRNQPQITTTSSTKKAVVTKASCTPERRNVKHKRNSRHTTTTSTRKAVHFQGTVQIIQEEEQRGEQQQASSSSSSSWYTPLEYKNFQNDSKRSLQAVTSNLKGQHDAYNSREHCLRGLEACLSSEVYHSRKQEKSQMVDQVLNFQLLQRLLGVHSDEHLATLSRNLSRDAQQRALLLAALDDSHRDTSC